MSNIRYNEPVPVLFNNKDECCGCAACYAKCAFDAISMCPDEEGFLYPVIDDMKCMRCGACLLVCPQKILT